MKRSDENHHTLLISKGTLTKKETIELASTSHKYAFPKSKCDKECIEAQLKAFYKDCTYPFMASTIGGGVPTDIGTDEERI